LINIKNLNVANFCFSLNLPEFHLKNLIDNQFKCLAIFILYQLKKPSADFKLYLDTIPKSFEEYPIFWPKEDIEMINDTIFINNVNKDYELIEKIKNMIARSEISYLNFTSDEIKHAYLSVGSREFGLFVNDEEILTLAPYTDLFNYDPNYNTVWKKFLTDENDYFVLKASKSIKKDKQIFLNYGSDDNITLLPNYGFTLKNNPFPNFLEYFEINYKGKTVNIKLHEQKSNKLVLALNEFKEIDKVKNDDIENKSDIEYNINFFKFVLNELERFNNKDLIKNLEEDLKKTPNTENIYRILISEDKVIDANKKYLEDFIKILEGGKENMIEFVGSQVMKQNKIFFQRLFS